MNPQSSNAPISDPSRVMEMITASRTDSAAPMRAGAQRPNPGPSLNRPRPVHLKLHIDTEDEQPSWSEGESVSAQQVDQLVQHLRSRQRELDQREADLQASVYRFEQQTNSNQAQLRKRTVELEHHLSQVKLQQAQLVKLQQNMINTQTALRKVVERIVSNCEPDLLKQELLKLKFELSESLDSILGRWERLKAHSA